jgi:hypothetical protein
MAPPLTEEPDGQDRDEKGRFRKGWRGGPGGAKQAYVRARATIYEALREEFSVDDVRALLRALYNQAMDGNSRSATLLLAYLCGKPPEAMSPRELFPAVRVVREPAMSLEALSARLQALLEDFEAGTVSGEEARVAKDILSSLVQAKQGAELERKLNELQLTLERSDNGEPS